ncbi:5-carboxymethyl-2-hydroxymuconate isomerase [Fonsecaea erecta]|uniref:5-carboxymethyl-2-hydroxymuconate isomerase n=1 Tax=Fonsecaea erecta TaxID=1367422 RepID=A0A178ZT87_9EURO|nr:5-carboxymethyl-2-hydroxymuconate isomerase [Fonsecaea erecta]OAP62631.1 5-carboxymethyl-2-hydroxymuconate isomerase [Fonsecaea erecta]
MAPGLLANGWHDDVAITPKSTPTRYPYENLDFDPKLQPKRYEIAGTSPSSKILFLDVNIIDSTGKEPYRGDVYIEGERIVAVGSVPRVEHIQNKPDVRVIQGRGRTLMSGLGDSHTHLTWNNNALELLGDVSVEEHVLITIKSALCYLDSGYTMCYGAASAKDRLDCVVRDAINRGDIPGPRYLANGREIARRDGELAAGITAFADGPLEMREVIRHHARIGVDQIKLSMSGESITETRSAEECFFSDEETAACVDEAHRHGLRVCSHARARDSVIQCVQHGVDVIYHASYTDEVGMNMLTKAKHKHVVAPAINWLYTTVHEAEPFGYTFEKAEQVGYRKELEVAITALKEMNRRGITVLPGGDYGFAWCPHGTYARDLEHFVKLLDFSPMESIIAATAGVAKLFMQENELGKILPGYYADCLLVNGDPLKDIAVLQDHDKLDVIMINGRIHKSSPADFVTPVPPAAQPLPSTKKPHNFVTFEDDLGRACVGHLDLETSVVHALAMPSGSPLSSLQQVIELGHETIIQTGESFPLSSVKKLLAPITDRDVVCVGNNYADHVKEYRESGYDNTQQRQQRQKNQQQKASSSFPTIFTKRSTSVVAATDDIYAHPGFTDCLDYEGEVGVIIGTPGFGIAEKDAMDHVWGYTIINDVTARDRQRDHGQFLMGKSPDTFCPMGPVAVPKDALPETLRVQTFVNGERRQDGTTADLITSIPKLIEVISAGLTLQAGDVIATGTPAGVGVGFHPPKFLKPGDLVEVSVTGLGKLSNRVSDKTRSPAQQLQLQPRSSLPVYNLERTWGGAAAGSLTRVGDKLVHVREIGSGSDTIVFVHGLGASSEYYTPLIQEAGLDGDDARHRIVLYDLEGHGLTPTAASSVVSVESYVADLENLFATKGITKATLVGWSLGGLIAMLFAERNSSAVSKLVLLGPGPNPFPDGGVKVFSDRAASVRAKGMDASGIAQAVSHAATSPRTQQQSPVLVSAVRQSLLATHPEGYAKGCMALAKSKDTTIRVEKLDMPALLVAGRDDKISPTSLAETYVRRLPNAKLEVLEGVGHWHVIEDVGAVARALRGFL